MKRIVLRVKRDGERRVDDRCQVSAEKPEMMGVHAASLKVLGRERGAAEHSC